MNLFDELRSVLAALAEAKVDYALAGGLAVAVWGAPRATKDMDFLVLDEDLPRAMAAVRSCGFVLEALPFDFKDGTTVHRVNKVDPDGNLMTVDLMLVGPSLLSAWQSRVQVPFAGLQLSVLSRDALIAMKARSARPQDLADIQNLRELEG